MSQKSGKAKSKRSGCLRFLAIIFIIGTIIFFAWVLPAFQHAEQVAMESSSWERAHQIQRALVMYANDHGDKYPEGRSSTEIFQKLLDGNYLADSRESNNYMFNALYFPMSGKVMAPPGAKILKPENICWDITCPSDDQSPNQLPVVFLTRYIVVYYPGATATPLKQAVPAWYNWWDTRFLPPFMILSTKDGSVRSLKVAPDGSIPNFIPADFDPKGKVYRQLTPNGELTP